MALSVISSPGSYPANPLLWRTSFAFHACVKGSKWYSTGTPRDRIVSTGEAAMEWGRTHLVPSGTFPAMVSVWFHTEKNTGVRRLSIQAMFLSHNSPSAQLFTASWCVLSAIRSANNSSSAPLRDRMPHMNRIQAIVPRLSGPRSWRALPFDPATRSSGCHSRSCRIA